MNISFEKVIFEFPNNGSPIALGPAISQPGPWCPCHSPSIALQLVLAAVGIDNDNENIHSSSCPHLPVSLNECLQKLLMFLFFVLRRVCGGELFDRVIEDEFILTERACAVFVRQICEGIEYIHSKNILHLDMKPENVMCTSRTGNRIKIIDFGLARLYDSTKKLQVGKSSISYYPCVIS